MIINMDNLVLLSIIIPAHDEENYITRSLESINNSNYKNYEIIVICDSCSDNTYKLFNKYTSSVHKVNLNNTARARNEGAGRAKGSVLVFCDADTIISEDYLDSIADAIYKGVDYGCVKTLSESRNVVGRIIAWSVNRFNKNNRTVAGNCFVKKELFLKVNGFDTSLRKGEDTDLGDRLSLLTDRYVFLEEPYILPSERRFREQGYIKHSLALIIESWIYILNKNYYMKKFKHDN